LREAQHELKQMQCDIEDAGDPNLSIGIVVSKSVASGASA
jgi:hypothetical protein